MSATANLYHRILVLVDLTDNSHAVLRRANALTSVEHIHLLHVIEFVPLEPMGETVLPTLQIETELVERAKQKLQELAQQYGLTTEQYQVAVGSIKTEAQRTAQTLACDLIVVGNHERHGLKSLLNFTEDAVLHIAPCDVLAVHLPN